MLPRIETHERPSPARCALCHEKLGVRELTCATCGTLLHAQCAAHLGRCPTLGCRGTFPGAPARSSATRRSKLLGVACIALGLTLFIAACTYLGRHREAVMEDLALRGIYADATVERITPSNHNQMYYSYSVNGATYEGHDYASGHSIGEKLRVLCLPDDPETHVLGDDVSQYRSNGAFWVMPMLMVSVFAGARLIIGDPRAAKR